MSTPSDIVNIALAEVGYREKASNSMLDDPAGNTGSNNWTKYARDLAAAGYYNGNKNGYAWCDVFVDWCFFRAFGKDEGQRIQCQTGDLGAGCIYSAQYFKAQGRYDSSPRVGDQMFFQYGGEIGHTGVVVGVTSTAITTVEGNCGDRVQKCTYSRSSNNIAGYGHPWYGDTKAVQPAVTPNPAVPVETLSSVGTPVSVSLNELEVGSTGAQVKTVQRIICACGIDPDIDIDGEFGEITKAGVVAMQKLLFPTDSVEWDGIIGEKTWSGMLTKLV